MDIAIEYLWAAGYHLPPEPVAVPKPVEPRRGKKAARARKVRKVQK